MSDAARQKVYVVSDGCYSDYEVRGIFTTLEAAENFARFHNYDNSIEEYHLDPETPEYDPNRLPFICSTDLKPGAIIRAQRTSIPFANGEGDRTFRERYPRIVARKLPMRKPDDTPTFEHIFQDVVHARDEAGAIKVMAERTRALVAGQTTCEMERRAYVSYVDSSGFFQDKKFLSWKEVVCWGTGNKPHVLSSSFDEELRNLTGDPVPKQTHIHHW